MNTFDQSYGAPTFGQRVYRAGDDKLDDYWPRIVQDQLDENRRFGYAEFALFDELEG